MKKSIQKPTVSVMLTLAILSTAMFSTVTFASNDLQEMEAVSKGLGLITLEEAKAKAIVAKPGVIKDADLENHKLGNGWYYEFEIAEADGKEWEVYIDAKTGKVNGIKRDWF